MGFVGKVAGAEWHSVSDVKQKAGQTVWYEEQNKKSDTAGTATADPFGKNNS